MLFTRLQHVKILGEAYRNVSNILVTAQFRSESLTNLSHDIKAEEHGCLGHIKWFANEGFDTRKQHVYLGLDTWFVHGQCYAIESEMLKSWAAGYCTSETQALLPSSLPELMALQVPR